METCYALQLQDLQKGAKGDIVKLLQVLLSAHGFHCGNIDGIYGTKTANAVLLANEKINIHASNVSIDTWKYLLSF